MSESRSDLALAAAVRLVSPLIDMLLAEGITYPLFAQALKLAFLEAATRTLVAGDERVNDSKLSLLSGVHRKDVREWRNAGHPLAPVKALGLAMEVFTRWVSDPAYGDRRGQPKILDRAGKPGSFEDLVRSVSTDVHSRAVLEELLRLGVVAEEPAKKDGCAPRLRLCTSAFVPKQGYAEMLQLLADNIGDHIAAAASNIKGDEQPLLEQAIFADGLTTQSAGELAELARKQWARTFREVVRKATALTERDEGRVDADQRVRFGSYFYHGPMIKP